MGVLMEIPGLGKLVEGIESKIAEAKRAAVQQAKIELLRLAALGILGELSNLTGDQKYQSAKDAMGT